MGLATPKAPFLRVMTTATAFRSPRGCALGPFAAPAPPHATEVEVFDAAAAAAEGCGPDGERKATAREATRHEREGQTETTIAAEKCYLRGRRKSIDERTSAWEHSPGPGCLYLGRNLL